MIKFFRKIRQQLLEENRVGKYLLYAIGEIVLVVIGILIALAINNWNENRKLKIVEQNYLVSLKEEFIYNLEMLEKVMDKNERSGSSALELYKYTGPDRPQLNEEKFASLLFGAISSEIQNRPNSGVLDEIISSGKLGIFRNKKLRSSLSSWSGIIVKVKFQEEELLRYRYKIDDLFTTKGNSRKAFVDAWGELFGITETTFNRSNIELLQSVEFENRLLGFIGASRFANDGYYPDLVKEINMILQIIDEELN